jgi:hypothetical protein
MVDFTGLLGDEGIGQRLAEAIRGKGAFRRFQDELHDNFPDLVPSWHAFRDNGRTTGHLVTPWGSDRGLMGTGCIDAVTQATFPVARVFQADPEESKWPS